MNTHLIAIYSAYWFIEAIDELRTTFFKEYAARIWQTLLILGLGMLCGAVNLFHSTEYWVNHAAVLKDCR